MRWWPQRWQNCAAALIRSATWGTFLLLYICITFLIQALNKRHLLLTILDNTGEPVTFIHTSHLALWDNCRSEHLLLGCICCLVSGEVHGEAHCSQNTNWNIVQPLVTLVTDLLLLRVYLHWAHVSTVSRTSAIITRRYHCPCPPCRCDQASCIAMVRS